METPRAGRRGRDQRAAPPAPDGNGELAKGRRSPPTATAYDGSRMERTVRRNEPGGYAEAVSSLWERVGAALVRLERVAESPAEGLADGFLDELPQLQYSLHAGAELAVGIDPPPGGEASHAELVSALGEARDITAEVGYTLEGGDVELVEPLLPEWRGRSSACGLHDCGRSSDPRCRSAPTPPHTSRGGTESASLSAIVATRLVIGGAFLFTAGAVLAAWPVWAAGARPVRRGFVLYR